MASRALGTPYDQPAATRAATATATASPASLSPPVGARFRGEDEFETPELRPVTASGLSDPYAGGAIRPSVADGLVAPPPRLEPVDDPGASLHAVSMMARARRSAEEIIAQAQAYADNLEQTARKQYRTILERAREDFESMPARPITADLDNPRARLSASDEPLSTHQIVQEVAKSIAAATSEIPQGLTQAEYVRSYASTAYETLSQVMSELNVELAQLAAVAGLDDPTPPEPAPPIPSEDAQAASAVLASAPPPAPPERPTTPAPAAAPAPSAEPAMPPTATPSPAAPTSAPPKPAPPTPAPPSVVPPAAPRPETVPAPLAPAASMVDDSGWPTGLALRESLLVEPPLPQGPGKGSVDAAAVPSLASGELRIPPPPAAGAPTPSPTPPAGTAGPVEVPAAAWQNMPPPVAPPAVSPSTMSGPVPMPGHIPDPEPLPDPGESAYGAEPDFNPYETLTAPPFAPPPGSIAPAPPSTLSGPIPQPPPTGASGPIAMPPPHDVSREPSPAEWASVPWSIPANLLPEAPDAQEFGDRPTLDAVASPQDDPIDDLPPPRSAWARPNPPPVPE